jgi:Fic family protein
MSDPASSGRLRFIPVAIAQSTSSIPQVIEECFDLLIKKANEIQDPFEKSFFLMVHIPYLQPFDDVNKRTSRLAANIPLFQKNLCPISFIDVPEKIYISGLLGVYESKQIELYRDVFLWAYERSSVLYSIARKTTVEPDPFRMKHRTLIYQTVQEIVRKAQNKEGALQVIRTSALSLPFEEQSKFIETVERELQALHEGNMARYHILPSEYENWKKTWIR